MVVAHPIILFAVRPELLALLNFIQAPWRARFAALSIYSLIALVAIIRYETWHLTHIVLAIVAVTTGLFERSAWRGSARSWLTFEKLFRSIPPRRHRRGHFVTNSSLRNTL